MNVYLLTNVLSGARALVFARVEHEARNRRPDGAIWRLNRWWEPSGHRVARALEWWPGSPSDVSIEPVMHDVDADSEALAKSPVMATKSMRRPPSQRRTAWGKRPQRPEPSMASRIADTVV